MTERHTSAPAPDQTTAHHPDSKPEAEQEKKSWLDLSPVQVVGGALAAMTAAGLGSRFSVEGTVVGAALASVIAAVAGALYTASLHRTSAAVRGVIGGRRIQAGTEAPRPVPHGSTAAAQPPSTADAPAGTSRRRNLVLSAVVGTVAIFGIAGGALTMYEAIAGEALSGGSGTTFSQVQQRESDNDKPTDEQSPTPTESPEPSESADPDPTAEPSETPVAESAPTTEPSAEPSVEPSAEPSATAEAEPSATAEQPSVAPSQPAQTPR